MCYRIYILALLTALLTGCGKDAESLPVGGTTIALLGNEFLFAEDEDNPAVEQTILNITILLTEPGSDIITHKYVNTGFSSMEGYKLVTLPDAPSALAYRDIYVVANYNNASLNSISTITDLVLKTTPTANKSNLLDPAKGICMFGKTLNHNFDNPAHAAAKVYVSRTCAKYRITLSFPEDPALSTDNAYIITDMPNYTYIMDNTGNTISPRDYFNFSGNIALTSTGEGTFRGTSYVYESAKAPGFYIYTRFHGTGARQEFFSYLPVPRRNHFYDIYVIIYEGSPTSRTLTGDNDYSYSVKITVYDEYGNKAEI